MGEKLYGFAKIDLNKKLVYTQWAETPNPDWSRGEDLVFDIHEEADKVIETLRNSFVSDVEVGEDGSITLWLKSKS